MTALSFEASINLLLLFLLYPELWDLIVTIIQIIKHSDSPFADAHDHAVVRIWTRPVRLFIPEKEEKACWKSRTRARMKFFSPGNEAGCKSATEQTAVKGEVSWIPEPPFSELHNQPQRCSSALKGRCPHPRGGMISLTHSLMLRRTSPSH